MLLYLKQPHSQFAFSRFSLLSGRGLIGVMQYKVYLQHSEFSIWLVLGAQFKHIVPISGSYSLCLGLASILEHFVTTGSGCVFGSSVRSWTGRLGAACHAVATLSAGAIAGWCLRHTGALVYASAVKTTNDNS